MIRFVLILIGLVALIAASTYGLSLILEFELPSFFETTLLIVSLTTWVLVRYLMKFAERGLFLQMYLASMVFKMIAFLAYCVIIVLKDREGALENMVFFLITYFLFTALEIMYLYQRISGQNNGQNPS